jgi:hypothetical protein
MSFPSARLPVCPSARLPVGRVVLVGLVGLVGLSLGGNLAQEVVRRAR